MKSDDIKDPMGRENLDFPETVGPVAKSSLRNGQVVVKVHKQPHRKTVSSRFAALAVSPLQDTWYHASQSSH